MIQKITISKMQRHLRIDNDFDVDICVFLDSKLDSRFTIVVKSKDFCLLMESLKSQK